MNLIIGKNNKALNYILKIVVVLFCFTYLLNKFTQNSSSFYQIFSFHHHGNSKIILLVILLMPLNWWLESIKWKSLISNVESISQATAIKGVLSGVTSSTFTPNRIGEFIGKILYLDKKNRSKGASISFLGSYIQLMVTTISGTIALSILYFTSKYQINDVVMLFMIITTSVIFCVPLGVKPLEKIIPERFAILSSTFSAISRVKLISASIYSTLRFLVFSTQFFLLLKFFNYHIELFEAAISIPIIYYFTSILPTISFAELGVREVTSVEVLQYVNSDCIPVVYATLSLWVINLIIPSIIGSYFTVRTRK